MDETFALRPIPIVVRALTTRAARRVAVDSSDARAAEPLVELRQHGIAGDNYYARSDGNNPPYGRPISGAIPSLLARKSIVERLALVNQNLHDLDLELYVVDAYRPLACQLGIWNFFWTKFRRVRPAASDAELELIVSRYVSDPRGSEPNEPPSGLLHGTGGSVDLTLRKRSTSLLLDMGTHIDDASEISHTDYFERLAKEGEIAPFDIRLQNRRRLYWSMVDAGFTNYSYEYWHFDFGNQMYVLTLRQEGRPGPAAAFYPYMDL